MLSFAAIIPVVVLVLLQGGYFSAATCACGAFAWVVVAAAYVRKPQRSKGISLVPMLFLGLACAYAVSSFVNGPSLTNLAETGTWFGVAAMALLGSVLTPEERQKSMRLLAWCGVATAFAGMLLQAELIELADSFDGDRLQFTLQYANAAAVWYGSSALLCLLSSRDALRYASAIPVAAMLLTRSGGGLLCFGVVSLALAVKWAREKRYGMLLDAVVQCVVAVASFLLLQKAEGLLGLLTILATIAVCVAHGCLRMRTDGVRRTEIRINTRMLLRAAVLLLLVLVAVICILMQGRISQAVESFAERLFHMRDGLSLWSTSPVVGVGPDNWRYLFPAYQSGPYYVTVIHCSYIQVMTDAGLLGIVLLVAAGIAGFRGLFAQRIDEGAVNERPDLWISAFIAFHAAIDFDLQFGCLMFLLAFLLSSPDAVVLKRAKGWVALACAPVCCAVCCLCLMCDLFLSSLAASNVAADYASCARLYKSNPMAQKDPSAQEQYLLALYGLGEREQVVNTYKGLDIPTDGGTITAAVALYDLDLGQYAGSLLVERMEAHPYDLEFYRLARGVVGERGLDPALVPKFNALVGQMNESLDRSGFLWQNPIRPYSV